MIAAAVVRQPYNPTGQFYRRAVGCHIVAAEQKQYVSQMQVIAQTLIVLMRLRFLDIKQSVSQVID